MKPGPAAEGMAFLAVALTAYALIFDDIAGLLAAGTVLLFLFFRGAVFFFGLSHLVSTLSVERATGKHIIRQGSVLNVDTSVSYDPGASLSVDVEDLIPAVAVAVGVQTVRRIEPGRIVIRHSFRVMAAGDTAFAGIRVSVKDPFFSASLALKKYVLREPSIRVMPQDRPFGSSRRGQYSGDEEGGSRPLLRGQETRGYREYIPGDGLELVDWKLSAKYGKMYVREAEGLSGGTAFLIVDLPDRHDALDRDAFNRYSLEVNSAVQELFTRSGSYPFLIVSGGEIISYVPPGAGEKEFFETLAAIQPVERGFYLFRYLDRTLARVRVRAVHREVGPSDRFRGRLTEAISAFGGNTPPLAFRQQVARAMRLSRTSSIILYTTALGDLSHIVQIVLEAQRQGMDVSVRALGPSGVATVSQLLAAYETVDVEEI